MPWKIVITGNLLDSKKGDQSAELCLAETETCQDIKRTDDRISSRHETAIKIIISIVVA